LDGSDDHDSLGLESGFMRLMRLALVVSLGMALGWWLSQPASAAHTVTHTVQPGDTLSQIAVRHGSPVDELIGLNGTRYSRMADSGGRTIVAGWELAVVRGQDVPRWRVLLDDIMQIAGALRQALAESLAARQPTVQQGNSPAALRPASGGLSLDEVELSLVAQTNAARASAGLPPLQIDATLMALARQRSQDMADRGYFGHKDPETDASMVWPYCIEPLNAAFCGENLAGATGLADAQANVVARWMASDGHRANILRPQFGRIGIGIAQDGTWGAIVTQLFAP
jgi:uncharacterized protein YkwD